ncbi:Maf family protein [Chryseobacterium sp. MFBS3-17]|uniref:Maf family protein n=1 Tax=Chryseobacterium sp. MFBS3-17 TaxID=2886689 RepID=UPI001D0E4B4D|nr:Maf family protein [Chryseobacterium sp. MFBS3-17]MCC2590428.1 Maf family protein [Chryseobacterium sp. MFBS3-17]
MKKILLASQSPRRKELLSQLGYDFETVTVECDEIYPPDLETKKIASFLSELKADAFGTPEPDHILLTADTIVALQGRVLGKPQNAQEAEEMLMLLSGKQHEVYTGITLRNSVRSITVTDVALVTMDPLTQEEIKNYVDKFRPLDKAGAYGIQEWVGMAKISRIEGSYYTIMGLPTHLVYRFLQEF